MRRDFSAALRLPSRSKIRKKIVIAPALVLPGLPTCAPGRWEIGIRKLPTAPTEGRFRARSIPSLPGHFSGWLGCKTLTVIKELWVLSSFREKTCAVVGGQG